MAGIFRNNFIDSTTMKRTALSPFCTSPGQLHDVTMDNSSYALGYKSPNVSLQPGSTSPAQGRSVREFEEQMAALQKENFNLKLRLYFTEEIIPGLTQANPTEGHESAVKQLIEAKIEMETLRKEIQEKQVVIQDAAIAMTQMENMQKHAESRNQALVEELNEKIRFMEMEKEMEKSDKASFMNELAGRSDVSGNVNAIQKIRVLEGTIKRAEEKEIEVEKKIVSLENELSQRSATIADYEEKLKTLTFQNAELVETLEAKDKEVSNAERTVKAILAKNAELKDENEILNKSILSLREMSRRDHENFESHEATIRAQQDALNEMHIKRLREELENEKREAAYKDCLIADGEKKIQELTQDYEKACRAIKNLVKHAKKSHDESSKSKKHLEEADETSGDIIDPVIAHLRAELCRAHENAKNSEKYRQECANLCSCLTTRLEELARFLDYLLHNKNILGFLGNDHRTKMITAVQESLDLSKRLSLSETGLSILDLSCTQLYNLSGELNASHNINRRLKTFISHEDDNYKTEADETFQVRMNSPNKAVKLSPKTIETTSNVQKKDRKIQSGCFENQSESEDWSEPDRMVSFERIGLADLSHGGGKSSSITVKISPGSIMAQTTNTSTDSDESAINNNKYFSKLLKTFDTITNLEDDIKQREHQIKQLQDQLCEAMKNLETERLIVNDLNSERENLRATIQELTAPSTVATIPDTKDQSTNTNDSFTQELLQKDDEKNQLIEEIKLDRDRLTSIVQLAEKQIISLKEEIKNLKKQQKENSSAFEKKLKKNLESLRKELTELKAKELAEVEESHRKSLENNSIARNVLEEKIKQLEKNLAEAQITIDDINEMKLDLQKELISRDHKIRELEKKSDEETLQASKAVVERTKALSDKLELEKHIDDLQLQIQLIELEKNEYKLKIVDLEQQICALFSSQNTVSAGGYNSEEIPLHDNGKNVYPLSGHQRFCNISPDLGIESDAGRRSSDDCRENMENEQNNFKLLTPNTYTRKNIFNRDPEYFQSTPVNSKTKGDESANQKFEECNDENVPPALNNVHDCAKIEQENAELRRKVICAKRAFEETCNKLRISNQKKKQIEKEIIKQILRTKDLIKKARLNIQN